MLSCVLHIHNLIILYRSTIQTTQITQKNISDSLSSTHYNNNNWLWFTLFSILFKNYATFNFWFVSTGTYLRHDDGWLVWGSTIILSHLIYFFNLQWLLLLLWFKILLLFFSFLEEYVLLHVLFEMFMLMLIDNLLKNNIEYETRLFLCSVNCLSGNFCVLFYEICESGSYFDGRTHKFVVVWKWLSSWLSVASGKWVDNILPNCQSYCPNLLQYICFRLFFTSLASRIINWLTDATFAKVNMKHISHLL